MSLTLPQTEGQQWSGRQEQRQCAQNCPTLTYQHVFGHRLGTIFCSPSPPLQHLSTMVHPLWVRGWKGGVSRVLGKLDSRGESEHVDCTSWWGKCLAA